MTEALWTLDQLAEQVDAALSVGYDGQASGRVRNVPDQRVIRYYTTLGLVDRPAARRGSTAMYGRRHLSQLVAIKKLQARGLPLARVQVELAGATDEQLERIAGLPPMERWVASPAPPYAGGSAMAARRADGPTQPLAGQAAVGPDAMPSRAAAFWKRGTAGQPGDARRRGLAGEEPVPPGERPDVATLQGVRLADGVTLLLDRDRPLRDDDVQAIQAAAGHLLEALRARGLGGRPSGTEPR
jgi:DNA-binding transcriptional MerR regulator